MEGCCIRRGWLLTVFFVAGVMMAAMTARAAVRVAVVSDGSEGQKVVAVVMGTVKDDGVEFVERDEVGRILKEQKLTFSGVIGAADVVKAGEILKADVFVMLESGEKGRVTGVRAFDAHLGAELEGSVFGAGADAAKEVERAIKAALKKRELGASGKTVCVVGVRNVDLPREKDLFCESIAGMLERRLIGSADVVVLERSRLDAINKERALPTAKTPDDLLSSVVTVHVEVGREGKGLLARGLLADAAGRETREVAVVSEAGDLAELAEKLAGKMVEVMKVGAVEGKVDRVEEGKRFLREAGMLLARGKTALALRAAEAAFALDGSPANRRGLVEMLMRHGMELINVRQGSVNSPTVAADPSPAMPFCLLALELRREAFGQLADRGSKSLQGDHWTYLTVDPLFMEIVAPYWKLWPAPEGMANFRKEYRAYVLEILGAYQRLLMESAGSPRSCAGEIGWGRYLCGLGYTTETPEEYLNDTLPFFEAYLEAIEKFGDKDKAMTATHGAADLRGWCRFTPLPNRWYGGRLSRQQMERMIGFWDLMDKSGNAAIRMAAIDCRIVQGVEGEFVSAEEARGLYLQLRGIAEKAIAEPAVPGEAMDEYRATMYAMVPETLDMTPFPEKAQRGEEYVSWGRFMLSRHEYSSRTVSAVLREACHFKDQQEAVKQLVADFSAAIDDPKTHFVESSFEQKRAKTLLVEAVEEMARFEPAFKGMKLVRGEEPVCLLQVAEGNVVFPRMAAAMTEGETVYALRMKETKDIQVVAISLKDRAVRELGRFTESVVKEGGVEALRYGAGMAADAENIYVGTKVDGVLVFGKNGGAVRRIGKEQGLPSNQVTAVAVMGDTLYVALGEGGYLVAFGLKDGATSVLISGLRKKKETAFDDVEKLEIPYLLADEGKGRVLFYGRGGGKERGPGGIWQVDAKTGAVSEIKPPRKMLPLESASVRMADGTVLLTEFSASVYLLDLKTDKLERLMADGVEESASALKGGKGYENRLQLGTTRWPYVRVGGEVYTGSPLGRVAGAGGNIELMPRCGTRQGMYWFTALLPMEERHEMVVVNDLGVWVLPLAGGH